MDNKNIEKFIISIGRLILIVLGSWILIHLFAFLGLFFAVAYLLSWLIFPGLFPSLVYYDHQTSSHHFFWQENGNGRAPKKKTFKNVLINFFIIILFTAVSLGIIYGEVKLLEKYDIYTFSNTANFKVISNNQYRTGEIFPMEIRVDGMHKPVNAIQVDISYDTEVLEVVSIDTSNSILTIFVQRDIAPEYGYVRISGGVPNPGILGHDAIIGEIYFKSKTPGTTEVSFADSSLVLINDGNGTNILNNLPKVSYLILPDKLSFEEKKRQDQLEEELRTENVAEVKTRIFGDGGEVLGVSSSEEDCSSSEDNWLGTIIGKIDSLILSLYSF